MKPKVVFELEDWRRRKYVRYNKVKEAAAKATTMLS